VNGCAWWSASLFTQFLMFLVCLLSYKPQQVYYEANKVADVSAKFELNKSHDFLCSS
jgi:hypothetical protein